jgi:NAD(P)-dependent dehydrogenase (short-subunit alcohol dehydrogenase family)
MAGRLQGKVAIVTGSTSGIGRATATLFGAEGAKVVVNGRRQELGQEVVDQIRAAGGEAVYHSADVSQRDQVQALVAYAVETYGRLDVLMNNAWSGRSGMLLDVTEESWKAGFAVGLDATFWACRAAIPLMAAQGGGAIINIASPHGMLAARHALPYAPVKAALIHLTRQIAVDYGDQGIRCNAICPGWIITEKVEERMRQNPLRLEQAKRVYPGKRPGKPIEIAYAALFLASDEASFVTGHAMVVDGGLTVQLQDSLVEHSDEELGLGSVW